MEWLGILVVVVGAGLVVGFGFDYQTKKTVTFRDGLEALGAAVDHARRFRRG